MQKLRLNLLGEFSLRTVDGEELKLPTLKDRCLLAFLAMQGCKAQSREKLAALLWADRAEAQARDSLRQSLAALRRVLRSGGIEPIKADRASVAFDIQALTIDAVSFSQGCAASAPTAELAGLYQGPFLEGSGGATPEYDHWMLQERQRLEELASQTVVVASISVQSDADCDAALKLAQRLLWKDPLQEPVSRALMRIFHNRGERTAALKVYAACRSALLEELEVDPEPETEALYRDILTGMPSAEADVSPIIEPAPDRATIAIIPFANLTGNDRLNFLCEGLAEDISTGMGRFRSVFIIDRYSTTAVASTTSDTVEIGKRLSASLLVQGSIQATASRLRITVRLVESASRAQTWSDVFEADIDDTPNVPDQIASAIITTVQNRVENTIVERSQRKPSMAAYECALRGIKHLRGYAEDDNEKAVSLFREALRLDPDYALAQAYLAFAEVVIHNLDAAPRDVLIDCKARVDRALSLDPDDSRIHWILASIHSYLREFDAEKQQLERALALNPNDANCMVNYGGYLACVGQVEEGLAMIRKAMRQNPFHPEWYWLQLGSAFLAARRHEDAIEAYKRRTRPMVWVLSRLAICYAHLGRDAEAQEMTRQILIQNPSFRISNLRGGSWSVEDIAHMEDGMRKAGLPP
jgi:DNA-binding SARP family transcriptional activator/TolB-like protein